MDNKSVRAEEAVLALSTLGDLDGAFAEVEVRNPLGNLETNVLFAPVTAPMRRDPRFWPLLAKLGLADYWLKTNHWPDMCDGPAMADCKAKAAAALTQAPRRT